MDVRAFVLLFATSIGVACGGKVATEADATVAGDEGVDGWRGGCGEGACTVGETCHLGCYGCVCEPKLGWRCTTGDCVDANSPCPATLPADGKVECTGTGLCEYSTPCRAIAVCGGGLWHTRGCG